MKNDKNINLVLCCCLFVSLNFDGRVEVAAEFEDWLSEVSHDGFMSKNRGPRDNRGTRVRY